ncbi:MAG: FecR family protein [Candidatus Cyclobacteriaceae bacterium M3_2C_046]
MNGLGWDILAKYLGGESNQDERQQVEAWRKLNSQNEAFFQKMKLVWQRSEKVVNATVPETDKAWESLSGRISPSLKASQPKERQLSQWPMILRYAAVFILFSLLGLGLWQLNQANHFQTFTTASTRDSLLLPDGSKVILNTFSSLRYPKKFSSSSRTVKLKGEGFFIVEPEADRPFMIQAGQAHVQVLGTRFNLKAPPDQEYVSCTVISGKVSLTASGQELILVKNQQGVWQDQQLIKTTYIGTNQISWYTRRFVFEETPLSQVIRELNQVYQKDITLENPDLGQCTITVSLQGERLEKILEIITMTLGMEFEATDETTFTIIGEGC